MRNFLPLHRLLGAVLTAILSTFVIWSLFGEIDIIASGSGKVIPKTFVKLSQPSEAGVVKAVLVKDGDVVREGQPLVELDPLYATQDVKASKTEVELLQLKMARIEAELSGKPIPSTTEHSSFVAAELNARVAAFKSAEQDALMASARASAELETAIARLKKVQKTSSLTNEQAELLKDLAAEQLVAKTTYLEKLVADAEASGELQAAGKTVLSAQYAKAQAQAGLDKVRNEYRRALLQEKTETITALSKAEAELEKREHRAGELVLKAPANGIVTGIAVKSPGQVVQAGAPLLSLVPKDEELIAEAWLKNEDAPYVTPGMPAKVKLVAYPFQKYGWVEGEVSWIGADSETPETMKNAAGELLFYKVRIQLKRQELSRNGEHFQLKTGMQAQVDVQLGSRSFAEYLSSPLKKVVLEAAREK